MKKIMIPVRATSQQEGIPLTGTWVNTGDIPLLAPLREFDFHKTAK
jgi:hypothetical protein